MKTPPKMLTLDSVFVLWWKIWDIHAGPGTWIGRYSIERNQVKTFRRDERAP